MPKLLIEEGGQQSVFELFDDEVTIGRGASNAVQVADSRASKHHASVWHVGGRMKLVDLESKNGTRVNGAFANQRWLVHGDTVEIGDAKMTYDASDVAAPRAPAGGSRVSVRVPGAAPAAAPAVATTSARARGGHAPAPRAPGYERRPRRARDEEFDDEEEVRTVPKRGGNSVLIAFGVGGGLVLLFVLLFLAMSHSGAGNNASALAYAKSLAAEGKQAEALRYLKQNGDPNDRDGYKSVQEEMDTLQRQMEAAATEAVSEDAERAYERLVRYKIELHKTDHSKEQLASDAREFAQKYMGTAAVEKLLENTVEDMPGKIREIMGEKPAFDAMRQIWAEYEAWKDKLGPNQDPNTTPNGPLGGRILEFQRTYAGTMKVYELERSPRDPYPTLRAIAGIK